MKNIFRNTGKSRKVSVGSMSSGGQNHRAGHVVLECWKCKIKTLHWRDAHGTCVCTNCNETADC